MKQVQELLVSIFSEVLFRTGKIYLGIFFGFLFISSPLKKFRQQFIDITINIVTPILILVSLLKLDGGSDFIYPIIISILVTVLGIIIPKLLSRIGIGEEPDVAELCTASFPNALNFPFPLIFALAPDSLGIAGIFLGVQILLRNTVGLWISGVKLQRSELQVILKFPPFWASILGVILRYTTSDLNVVSSLLTSSVIAWTMEIGIFMTLMTVGFSITKPSGKYITSYVRVGLSRFLISPLLLLPLLSGTSSLVLVALIIQVMAPPAVYNGIYAEKFNLDTERTSNVIMVLTLVALIILPLEFYLIDTFIA